jgi:hypothetical protein
MDEHIFIPRNNAILAASPVFSELVPTDGKVAAAAMTFRGTEGCLSKYIAYRLSVHQSMKKNTVRREAYFRFTPSDEPN